jgi:hypothetical protein
MEAVRFRASGRCVSLALRSHDSTTLGLIAHQGIRQLLFSKQLSGLPISTEGVTGRSGQLLLDAADVCHPICLILRNGYSYLTF